MAPRDCSAPRKPALPRERFTYCTVDRGVGGYHGGPEVLLYIDIEFTGERMASIEASAAMLSILMPSLHKRCHANVQVWYKIGNQRDAKGVRRESFAEQSDT